MKKVVLLMCLFGLSAGPALSFSLSAGGLDIKFTAYGHGAIDGPTVNSDLSSSTPIGGGASATFGSVTTTDDFFGIFIVDAWKINGITEVPASGQVFGIFYGSQNIASVVAGSGWDNAAVGGRYEFYHDADATGATWASIFAQGTSGYVGGTSVYTGINDGASGNTFLFGIDLVTGVKMGTAVYGTSDAITDDKVMEIREFRPVSGNPSAFTGNGDWYGNVDTTTGSVWNLFDTNTQGVNPDNGNPSLFRDFQGAYDMNPYTISNGADWAFQLDDPLQGATKPIPEPSTLLLLGTGLLGMVGYARRRKAA